MTEFNPLLHNLQPVNYWLGEWTPQAWDPQGQDNQPNSRLTIALPVGERQPDAARTPCVRPVAGE